MFALLFSLAVSAALSVVFLLIMRYYRVYLDRVTRKREKIKKDKSLDQLLDKYVVEEKKDVMKDKLSKISKIISETEKEIEQAVKEKTEVAEEQVAEMKAEGEEKETIKKAKNQYLSFSSGLRAAMPETDKEREEDMRELKNTISQLEELDSDTYLKKEKKFDAGAGMFYDKMTQKFKAIISEHKLDEFQFIPVQRIKYHAFQDIKNIKDEDIMKILEVMDKTNLINNIIEINPAFKVITFDKDLPELNLKEKVVLTFVYEEDYLTVQKLMELTEWSEEYTEKILEGLEEKDIVEVLDENIQVEGLGHEEEKNKWEEVIEEKIAKEKKKQEAKRKRRMERERKLKQKLAKIEKGEVKPKKEEKEEKEKKGEISRKEAIDQLDKIKAKEQKVKEKTEEEEEEEESPPIKFKEKPSAKTLPAKAKKKEAIKPKKVKKKKKKPEKKKVKREKPKPKKEKEKKAKPEKKKGKSKLKAEEEQKIKDKDNLLQAMEALDEEMKFSEAEEKKQEEDSEDLSGLLDEELDMEDLGDKAPGLEDLVPEKILEFHEKYTMVNGGFVQYEKIKDYVIDQLGDDFEDISDELIKTMLVQLKELMMVHGSMDIGDHEIYLFNPVDLSEDEKEFIEFNMDKKPMKKKKVIKELDWEEEKILKIMKKLQEKNLLRIEKNKIKIPGIIQEKK
ncbi:MAG: hypothetical protein R6U96_05315 [Promethearchaeia archaeon]